MLKEEIRSQLADTHLLLFSAWAWGPQREIPSKLHRTCWHFKQNMGVSTDDHACPHCPNILKQVQRAFQSVFGLCAHFPAQAPDQICSCQRCLLGIAWLPVMLERKLDILSGGFLKNTEMSAATTSNREMQPENEPKLHQFQDSLLASA